MSTVLGFLAALLGAIPILYKIFHKTPTKVVESERKKLDKEEQDFKESGRPKWD